MNPHIYPEPSDGRPWWPWVILVVAAACIAGAGWYAYAFKIRKDSPAASRAGSEVDSDLELTEPQYRELRKVFEESHHADIRTAGVKMMDVWWQMVGLGPNAGLEALPYVTQLMTAITDLRGACTKHGIAVRFDLGTPQFTPG